MATRVLVGMSGGVDSAVAAGLLREAGFEVVGVTLHLWDYQREGHAGRCCAPEDQYDARRVCDTLGIAHYTFDRRELFRERVVDPFIAGYRAGHTPSPCVQCNEHVKLGPLHGLARRLGAQRIATGHYARIAIDDENLRLEVATDRARDQSYFLFAAPIEALRCLELPLGAMTKDRVREHAMRLGLSVAQKPDSTDLCFVEGQSYDRWLADHGVHTPAGPIESVRGEVLGRHEGILGFTVGQRRGLGALGGAKYVLKIIPERAAVVVGDDEEARTVRARVERVRWLTSERPTRVHAKLRYRHTGVFASVYPREDGVVELELEEAQRGVAPGQAAVFYDGDRVVGGGYLA